MLCDAEDVHSLACCELDDVRVGRGRAVPSAREKAGKPVRGVVTS